MKIIQLIIAIAGMSFACYGQNGAWGKSTSAEPYGFLPDTPSVKQLSIEEKLLLYAQQCWNDSTLQQVPYVCFPGCMVNHYPEWKYIHRKPTFEGFIEWLKKK